MNVSGVGAENWSTGNKQDPIVILANQWRSRHPNATTIWTSDESDLTGVSAATPLLPPMTRVGLDERARRWSLPRHRVEKFSPLLAAQVELEVTEWANASRRQLNLPRHAPVDARVDHDFPTIYLANWHPGCVTQSAAG
jgi:hypothetical protein